MGRVSLGQPGQAGESAPSRTPRPSLPTSRRTPPSSGPRLGSSGSGPPAAAMLEPILAGVDVAAGGQPADPPTSRPPPGQRGRAGAGRGPGDLPEEAGEVSRGPHEVIVLIVDLSPVSSIPPEPGPSNSSNPPPCALLASITHGLRHLYGRSSGPSLVHCRPTSSRDF